MLIGKKTINQVAVARSFALLAILGGLLLQCIGAWTDSQTTDEGAHLAAGLSYWRTGDFRLNPEHPPLLKLLAALPLVSREQLQPTAVPALWAERDQWNIGRLLLYHQLDPRTETPSVLWLARLPMIAIWLMGAIIVWRWAEARTTPAGGTIAAILYTFEPTLLGHGHLVTTDVGVAVGMTATLWIGDRMIRHPRWRTVLLFAIVFSLTQLSKFSALILWPIIIGLTSILAVTRQPHWQWRWWRRAWGMTLLVSSLLTWGIYGFERVPAANDPRIDRLWRERDSLASSTEITNFPPIVQYLVRATPPGSRFRQALESFSQIPIPAYSYWRGVFAVTSHNTMGHAGYLFGEQRFQGWWYYFLVALAVKLSLPFLALLSAMSIAAWKRRHRMRETHHLWLIIPGLLFLLWSLTSRINIGVRHVLPVLPLACIACAHLVTVAHTRWRKLLLWMVVGATPLVTLLAWPNTLGYFNALAGGTAGGHRILLDSNLDWNQDLWRLRHYLDTNGQPPAMIALFGSVPVEVVHPHPERIPTDQDVATSGQPHALVIISKGILYSLDLPFHWLRQLTPTDRVGSSILVYDLR